MAGWWAHLWEDIKHFFNTTPAVINGAKPTSPSSVPASPYGGIYQSGNSGPVIAAIQTKLKAIGYHLVVDGDYGPETEAAVIAFQKDHFIGQSGVVGLETGTALFSAVANPPVVSAPHGSGHSPRPRVDVDLRAQCPNHASRNGVVIDTIIHHNTEGSLDSAEARFEEPVDTGDQVSAHLIISRDGRTIQMVDESLCAWHSGDHPTNQRSLGMEIVAGGGQGTGMTTAQEATVIAWTRYWMDAYGIKVANIHPHRYVVSTSCPGSVWSTDDLYSAWKAKNL